MFLIIFFVMIIFAGTVFSDELQNESLRVDKYQVPLQVPPYADLTVKDNNTKPSKNESYRVFFPTDNKGKIIDNTVWLPEEFFRLLHKLTHEQLNPNNPIPNPPAASDSVSDSSSNSDPNSDPNSNLPAPNVTQSKKQQWQIESAEYIGSLVFNPITKNLELSEFKAIYQIDTESDNVTIFLPSLPLSTAESTWDDKPIRSEWQIDKKIITNTNDNNPANDQIKNNRTLSFEISHTTRGKHKLEIPLDPPTIRLIDNFRINFDIPKIPNTILKLTVPHNAPAITIIESLGAITQTPTADQNKNNNDKNHNHDKNPDNKKESTEHQITAELGQVEKLAFTWNNDLYHDKSAEMSAESFIKIQAYPSQIDVRIQFNYKINNGKIRYINVLLDNHWQISGQFLCDENQIDRVETFWDNVESSDGVSSRREVARIIFKSPVSGSLTLRAGFVLSDFAGIGQVRLPDIRPFRVAVNKSLLAVSADPQLEIQLPKQGQNNTVSPQWNDMFNLTPNTPASSNAAANTAAGIIVTKNTSQPFAEYDTTKTAKDWKLSISAKKQLPLLTLVQSALLDAGDSTLQCNGEFESLSEIFHQTFTLPHSVVVDSIDVYDAQRNPVGVRWGRTLNLQVVNNEPRIERMIFFRRPLSGKYKINVTGHFLSEKINRVPLISFDDVKLHKHQFELYRTSAVIIHGNTTRTVWQKEHTSRNVFANAKFISSWTSSDVQTADNTISPFVKILLNHPIVKGEITTIMQPIKTTTENTNPLSKAPNTHPNTHPNLQQISTSTSTSTQTTPVSATVAPTTASPTASSNAAQISASNNITTTWDVIFDVDLNITSGELEQIRLQLDERIASVNRLEPPVNWHVEQQKTNGQTQLIISPNTISGKQHFKIYATLNNTNRAVSLPKIIPEWDSGEQAEIQYYAILPIEIDSEEQTTDNTAKLDDEDDDEYDHTDPQHKRNKKSAPIQIAWNLSNLQNADETLQKRLAALLPTAAASLFLRATDEEYSASIIQGGIKPIVTFCDVNLHINRKGNLFGIVVFDMKNLNDDKFIIAIPDGYELIRILMSGGAISNGSIGNGGIKLERNRWRLELAGSDYSVRVGLIFRATLNSMTENIPLPALENIDVNETIWTVSFEDENELAKSYLNVIANINQTATAKNKQQTAESLGSQKPVSGEIAAEMLFKFDMIRLDNLLHIASNLPTPTAGKNIELKNWLTQWEYEWSGINRTINYLKTTFPSIQNITNENLLLTPPQKNKSSQRSINSLIGLMDTPEKTLQALQIRKERESQRSGIIVTKNHELTSLLESNPVVLCRILMTKSGTNLFGAIDGNLSGLHFKRANEPLRVKNKLVTVVCLITIIIIATSVIITARRYRKNAKTKNIRNE